MNQAPASANLRHVDVQHLGSHLCSNYSYLGSTAYTVRMTRRVCGHSTTARRNENFKHTPDKTTSRTYCRQCGSFIDETTMQFRKEPVAIGKRIEKAPGGVVEAAASFTSPETIDETIPTPFLQQITGESAFVSTTPPSKDPSLPDLHELLAECIQDIRTQGGESPDSPWDLVAQVGIDNHPDGSDLVPFAWDPNDNRIWAALDAGCNSTCHSKSWGELASPKLDRMGLKFDWEHKVSKEFARRGATTKTLGKRNMPFAIRINDDAGKGIDTLTGLLSSHQIDTKESNSMLLSLFAQQSLRLVKDLSGKEGPRVYTVDPKTDSKRVVKLLDVNALAFCSLTKAILP